MGEWHNVKSPRTFTIITEDWASEMKYIIEVRNGSNPRILMLDDATGEDNLVNVAALVKDANSAPGH